MFDWDKDYDDLVKGTKPTLDTLEVRPIVQNQPAADPAATSLRAIAARWFAPALVVAGLATGVAFPEKFGIGGQSTQTAAIFAPFQTKSAPTAPTVTLRAYTDAQHRNFVFGLKRFSDADLVAYAAVTQADLDRAGPMLAPMLQDALTLTHLELEQRNLVAPSAVRSVQDVVIQTPLQG